jgi:virginiamycin B lyase
VTSTVEYTVITYPVSTVDGEPYDLDYAAGAVWFTERAGNKIGRLDVATGAVDEFPVPTLNGGPTGIDVVSGSPTRIWFTQQSGNKLGQSVVTGTVDYAFIEYPLPTGYSNAQPEDICVRAADSIWFTAPNISHIGNLKPSLWPQSGAFVLIPTGSGSQPWAITVDSDGFPWFTEPSGNRIGQFFPQTISDIRWYTLPHLGSDPYDLVTAQGYVWFTQASGDRIGQLDPGTRAVREFGLMDGSAPKGAAVDSGGCVWVAESGRDSIAQWCPPYFRFVHLPLVLRNYQ